MEANIQVHMYANGVVCRAPVIITPVLDSTKAGKYVWREIYLISSGLTRVQLKVCIVKCMLLAHVSHNEIS